MFLKERPLLQEKRFSMQLTGNERKWFVLYTKPQNEKRVNDGIRQLGIESFCPMIKTRKKWSDRFKLIEQPLFKSYCFVRLPERERARVFEVPGVVRYLFWLRQPAIVRQEEIEAIKELLASCEHDSIRIQNFTAEDTVRIKSGVFSEMTGIVERQEKNQLFLYLEALQLVINVDLRGTSVEKIKLPTSIKALYK